MNPELIKKIAIGAAAAVTLIIITTVLVSKAKDHAHKEFTEKHDAEMAEKLSKSFNNDLEKVEKTSISKFKADVNRLCRDYQIAPAF